MASSRTAAVARRIAAGSRAVLKLLSKATVPFLAASPHVEAAAANDDLFTAVLSILAAACTRTRRAAVPKLKASGIVRH